jgi:hypothetical protein
LRLEQSSVEFDSGSCDQERLPEVKGAVLTRAEVVLRIPGCQSDFRMRLGFSSERFLNSVTKLCPQLKMAEGSWIMRP